MSTLISDKQTLPLQSEEELVHYFADFAKPKECMRVGLEAEFFTVDRHDGRALAYEAPSGVGAQLHELALSFGYEPIFDGDALIALRREDMLISLEPGGQMELSASPVRNVFEIERQLLTFLNDLRGLQKTFPDVTWLACGIQPFSKPEEISWVPKKRYGVMAEYLRSRGTLSHEMMKITATNQVNFDYLSEEHAMANLRTVFGITPVVSGMFAHASISGGAPNGFMSRRLEIWRNTDPERTGILYPFLDEGRTFRDYLNYILDMPAMFVVRDGRWIPLNGIPFRRFIREGHEGLSATWNDFELQLSTAFPEARIKQYLEIRGVDGQLPHLIPAVAAFWKGILYDDRTRDEAWKLVAFASRAEREQLWADVPRQGLKARLGNRPILGIARDMVDLACQSLAGQTTDLELRSECIFLDRIRNAITRPGKSPGESLLEKWQGPWHEKPQELIRHLSI